MPDFPLHDENSAPEAARPLFQATKEKFGFTPNLIRIMAESPETAKAYLQVSELFQNSGLGPKEQQVVLLATSVFNGCTYCVAAHTAIGKQVGLSDADIEALRAGKSVSDARLEALRRFTVTMVENRGRVPDEEVSAFLQAGFERRNILDVLLGVTQKTISNYTNHLAGTPLDEAFEAFAWEKEQAVGA